MAPKAMHKKPAAQGKVKKPAAKLSEKHSLEAMRKKTEDVLNMMEMKLLEEVAKDPSMGEKVDEKKLLEDYKIALQAQRCAGRQLCALEDQLRASGRLQACSTSAA